MSNELERRTPIRPPSATKVPLNNTAALLGPELNAERLAALEQISRSQKPPPDIGVN